jgi:hypothetical protein
MLDFLGRLVIVCFAALVVRLIANGSSLAESKAARTTTSADTSSGSTNNATPGSPQSSDSQAGTQSSSGINGSWAGGDQQLGTSIQLKDTWSLQFGGGVDFEQQQSQSRSNPAGDVNGRVGVGLRF